MKDNIKDFMDKVEIVSKDVAVYKNEEDGTMFPVNTITLLSRVDHLELTKEEYEKAKFENKIDKKLDYNIVEILRPQSKYFETKKEEDKYTIIEAKVKVRDIYNVANGIGIYKSFTNKEEAFKLSEEINSKVIPYFK